MTRQGPPSSEMLAKMRKLNGAIPNVEILDGNIGYMRVNGMPPPNVSGDAIAAAFAFLRNTDALIIDLRANGGGEPKTVALYLSYVSEGASYVTRYIHWRKNEYIEEFKTTDLGKLAYGAKKPIFALTSHRTFSGVEGFAYDLQAFKRGVIIGETTAGGAHPGGFQSLGHGFMTFMPTGYAVNPVTNSNWEGVGVKPDFEVPAGHAFIKAEILAVESLKGNATDPTEREALDAYALYYKAAAETRPPSEAQLIGQYGGDQGPSVIKRDEKLYLRTALNGIITQLFGQSETEMIWAGGGRYKLKGLPYYISASFVADDKKVTLVIVGLEQPKVMQKL